MNKTARKKLTSKEIISAATNLTDKLPKALDITVNLGLAYLGYQTFRDWRGALVGPVSYALAKSPNIAGSIAGVGGLTILGLFSVAGEGIQHPPQEPMKAPEEIGGQTCQQGYTLMIRAGAKICIIDEEVHYWQGRGWEKFSDYLARGFPEKEKGRAKERAPTPSASKPYRGAIKIK